MPNLIPDWLPWMRPAGRLIWACALLAIGLGIAFWLFKRPKPDRPATWSECMAGAVGVFALMTLGYAVIPHEFITFSDKYLQWDTTKFVFRASQDIFFLPIHWPFTMDQKAVRDIIVVGIYSVLFGLNLVLFAQWQNRGKEPAAATEATPRTSRFGRPLRRARSAPAPVTSTVSGNGES
ncbi:MAG: hypothetical protein WD271_12430 [Acidimicrobiia bacterium]